MNNTEQALFKLLHIAITDSRDYIIHEDSDWTMLFQLACEQGVVAIACNGLFDKGYDVRKYKNNTWAFNLGIKLYTMLGLDHRIRK